MQTAGSGWTNTSRDYEKGRESTNKTLHPCRDETGPDTHIALVGAEDGQAASTLEATLSSTVEAGSSSVRESPPDSVASGNKDHEDLEEHHIDEVHPQ